MAMGGDLGLGPIGSGPVASIDEPVGTAGTPTAATVTKLNVYAILDGSPNQNSAGVSVLKPYAVVDGSPNQNSVGVSKFSVYAILGPVEEPLPFLRRLTPIEPDDDEAFLQRRLAPPAAPAAAEIPAFLRRLQVEEDEGEEPWRRRVFSPVAPPPPGQAGLPWRRLLWVEDEDEEEDEFRPVRRFHFPATGSPYPQVTKLVGYAVLDSSPNADQAGVTGLRAYGLLDASPDEISAGVTDLRAYGLLDASAHEDSAAVTDFRAYGLLEPIVPPTPIVPFEPLFPPNLSFGAVGGCGWKTTVALTASGRENRIGGWERTRGRWTVSHNLRTPEQVAELEAFHRLFRGKYGTFRLKDWLDYTVVAGEGVLMRTPLQRVVLAKQYSVTDLFGVTYTALRPITRPRPFTVVFDPLGPVVDYYTGYVTGGLVGVTTWTGEFDVPVRFEADEPRIEKVMPTGSGWRNISFVEYRQEI